MPPLPRDPSITGSQGQPPSTIASPEMNHKRIEDTRTKREKWLSDREREEIAEEDSKCTGDIVLSREEQRQQHGIGLTDTVAFKYTVPPFKHPFFTASEATPPALPEEKDVPYPITYLAVAVLYLFLRQESPYVSHLLKEGLYYKKNSHQHPTVPVASVVLGQTKKTQDDKVLLHFPLAFLGGQTLWAATIGVIASYAEKDRPGETVYFPFPPGVVVPTKVALPDNVSIQAGPNEQLILRIDPALPSFKNPNLLKSQIHVVPTKTVSTNPSVFKAPFQKAATAPPKIAASTPVTPVEEVTPADEPGDILRKWTKNIGGLPNVATLSQAVADLEQRINNASPSEREFLRNLQLQMEQQLLPLSRAISEGDEAALFRLKDEILNNPKADNTLKEFMRQLTSGPELDEMLSLIKKRDSLLEQAEAGKKMLQVKDKEIARLSGILKDAKESNATSKAAINGTANGVKAPDVDAREKLEARIEELKKVAKDEEEERKALVVEATRDTEAASKAAKQTKDPYKALEAKLIDVYAEQRRREKEEVKARNLWQAESTNIKRQLDKTAAEKKRYEEISRALAKERNVLRDDHKKLESRMKDLEETVQKHIKALPPTFDDPIKAPEPLAAISPYNPRPRSEQPSEILITVSSRYRTDLWFKISRTAKLSKIFEAWKEKMAESVYEEAPVPATVKGKNKGKGKKKEVEKIKYEGLPKFVFTLYGKALHEDMTPEQLDMRDKDEIAVFELLDLTENLSDGFPRQASEKLVKYWPTSTKDALDSLEEILEIVTRERLKSVIRQYEIREDHWMSIMNCKDLELMIYKAKLEAKTLLPPPPAINGKSPIGFPTQLPLPPNLQNLPTNPASSQFAALPDKSRSAYSRPVKPLPTTSVSRTTPELNSTNGTPKSLVSSPEDPAKQPLSKGDLASIHLHINYGMVKDQVTSLSEAVNRLLSLNGSPAAPSSPSFDPSTQNPNVFKDDLKNAAGAWADIRKVQNELEKMLPALQKTRDEYGADEATMIRVREMVKQRQEKMVQNGSSQAQAQAQQGRVGLIGVGTEYYGNGNGNGNGNVNGGMNGKDMNGANGVPTMDDVD